MGYFDDAGISIKSLINGINHQDVSVRLESIQILGLGEETEGLIPLRQHFKEESDPAVKQAMNWAGYRIHAAKKRNYTTLNEIFNYFKIDLEIDHLEDPTESELIKKIDDQFDKDLRQSQTGANMRSTIKNAAVGFAVGGASVAATSAMNMGAGAASSNLGSSSKPRERITAPIPSDANIVIWLRRMRTDEAASDRAKAAMEITRFNNPIVLPDMADALINEQDEEAQEAIEKAGKTLYLNAIYWSMTKDGTIDAEYMRRATALGKEAAARKKLEGK